MKLGLWTLSFVVIWWCERDGFELIRNDFLCLVDHVQYDQTSIVMHVQSVVTFSIGGDVLLEYSHRNESSRGNKGFS